MRYNTTRKYHFVLLSSVGVSIYNDTNVILVILRFLSSCPIPRPTSRMIIWILVVFAGCPCRNHSSPFMSSMMIEIDTRPTSSITLGGRLQCLTPICEVIGSVVPPPCACVASPLIVMTPNLLPLPFSR